MSSAVPGPCDRELAAAALPCPTPHPRAALAATILGSRPAFIHGSVVTVALPAIGGDFGAGSAQLSWTIKAYLRRLGALILLGEEPEIILDGGACSWLASPSSPW